LDRKTGTVDYKKGASGLEQQLWPGGFEEELLRPPEVFLLESRPRLGHEIQVDINNLENLPVCIYRVTVLFFYNTVFSRRYWVNVLFER